MLGENAGHRPRLHKLFLKGLAVAAGQRRVMMTPFKSPKRKARTRMEADAAANADSAMNRVKTLPTNVRY
jgi:hypothetical protein